MWGTAKSLTATSVWFHPGYILNAGMSCNCHSVSMFIYSLMLINNLKMF